MTHGAESHRAVDTSRPIALNGNVITQLQDLSGNTTRGGHVWFYSPGGIVVGATAVFDVGGCSCGQRPIELQHNSNGLSAAISRPRRASTANVTIAPAQKITATPRTRYVAIVATRVVQTAASASRNRRLCRGRRCQPAHESGVFDIQVNAGNTGRQRPSSTRATPAASDEGAGDNHGYTWRGAQEQALTLRVSGNAGFTPAATASVVNGTIVLAAGSNVSETSGP